jgi:hypothetical protein
MRRFSVRGVMILIVDAAVGLAALRNANGFWAPAIATVVVVSVATSVVGALTLRGRGRYVWAGFAVFSGVYLAVAVGTLLSAGFNEYFGPTVALRYVQSKVRDDLSNADLSDLVALRARLLRHSKMLALPPNSSDEKDLRTATGLQDMNAQLEDGMDQRRAAMLDSADRWRSWLPGAVNADEFYCVGHSLFALLSGLIGTVVGRIFYARRERTEAQTI